MKSLVYAIVAASALAAPFASFAQSTDNNGPVTRDQVRQELIQLEQAGYRPAMHDPYYPEDIQAAEARVHQQQGAVAAGETSGYGGVAAGSAQAGSPSQVQPVNRGPQSVYFGQ